jgi:formylglycine-generating enzyme required for sulfatase activity
VEARRERYHNDTKQMQVELGKTHNLSLHPKPKQGELTVVTIPTEAKIILNGIDYDITPYTIRELLVGEYTLEIVKDGHATVTKTITITEGKTTVVNENLSSGMEVTIASNPSGAQLTIDGVSVGSTPFTTMLGFGIHKLKLVNGKKILNEEVFVKQDGKNKWEFDVQSGKDIAIGSDPVGLEVIIDGLSYGKAPVRTNISYGKHNIKIVNGNRVVEETIDVTRDDKNIWIFNNEDFDEPEMVLVNGGRFTMGCTREQGSSCDWPERPTRVVSVNDFYISKYEVTQSLWKAIMGKRPSVFSICDNCPVENISWNDAQIFIKKLNEITKKNYRLPTEAEWEFAARGGTSSKGFIYSGGNKIEAVAWYLNNSTSKTHPVGLKKPNELGIYDMTGNVYEWCSDWFGNYPDYSQTNPKGPSNGKSKVFRGGGFAKEKGSCRVSFRGYNAPDYKDGGIGLRLVLSSY